MGASGQHHCLAGGVLFHEQVAAELCLQNRAECLDFHTLRPGGSMYCPAHRQLSVHQSGHRQSG